MLNQTANGMDDTAPQAQPLHQAIRQLLNQWDPIGIADVVEDEYDSYVPDLVALLTRRASAKEVGDYLWSVETQRMGLTGNRDWTAATAVRLVALMKQVPA